MSTCIHSIVAACVVHAACGFGAARAADIKLSGSLAVTSDYVQQGLSQTRGEPALQGGVRAQFDERWTVGTWASGIDRYAGPSANLEIDLYAGRAFRITPEWIASLTAMHRRSHTSSTRRQRR